MKRVSQFALRTHIPSIFWVRHCLCACLFAGIVALMVPTAAKTMDLGSADIDKSGQKEIAKYERLVARHPKDKAAWVKLGDLLYSYHRSGDAVERWKQALAIDDALVNTHWSLGVVYAERGDAKAAEAEYLAALRIDPSHFAARNNLAVIYREQGDLAAAKAEYLEILKSQPDESFVHDQFGQILAEEKHWTEAIAEYRIDLAQKGSTGLGAALTRIDLAESLVAVGELEAAEREIDRANAFLNERMTMHGVSSWPASPRKLARTRLAMAHIRARQERPGESIAALSEALGYDASLLESVEADADFRALREREDYRRLVTTIQAQNSKNVTARFIGTVRWIEVIGVRAISAALVERDAQWAVAVDISDAGNASPLFDKPGQVILTIHSPVRLLARSAESAIGKSYSFEVGGERVAGKPVYHWVQAHEAFDAD
jgi:predicted Zn-dependent protease